MSIVTGNIQISECVREFLDGSHRSTVKLKSAIIGLGTYLPGWKWSLHAGTQTGKSSENHIGYIISGQMIIRDSNGHAQQVVPGEAFEISPGHDAWVIGTEPCVALDFTHIL